MCDDRHMAASPDAPPSGDENSPEPRDRAEVIARIHRTTRAGAGDALARLTARILGASMAHVSIVDDAEQVYAGVHGLPAGLPAAIPAQESICRITTTTDAPVVVQDAGHDERVAELPAIRAGLVGAYLGVPLHVGGHTVGALCVLEPGPRTWAPEEHELLAELARSVETELEAASLASELSESDARRDLGFDAAGIGSFDWDLETGALDFDERLNELFGFARSAPIRHIDELFPRIHPADLGRVQGAMDGAITRRGEYEAEYRIVLGDGSHRWISARGRVLGDPEGRAQRMLGAALDTSEAHAGADRLSRILETLTTGFYALDAQWRFTYVNAAAERLLGRGREELLGQPIWRAYPGLDETQIGRNAQTAVLTGETVSFETYYAPLDTWFEITQAPGSEGLSVFFRDVGTRHQAEMERAEATERLRVLATASAELAGTRDVGTSVGRLARLVVPLLSDWCMVTLLQDDGTLRVVGSWHRDPDRREDLAAYVALQATALSPDSTTMRAMLSGDVVVARDIDLAHHLTDPEAVVLAGRLGTSAAATIPLVARGRTIGTFSLINGPARGAPGADELTAATELAVRAALAIDNAELHEAERRMSEVLQRSMLSEPPEPDHLHIVTRYRPAADHAQVGGDWYDSFVQPDGTTMLVIGDVMGHDISAAAAMGQLRTMVRTIATDRGAGPAEVLTRVDGALRTLGIDTFATAAVLQVRQTPAERPASRRRLRLSSAGHLPPLLRGPDDRVERLTGGGVVLGVDTVVPRTDREVVVEAGSVVLLYTDGLVERRGEVIDVGIDRLAEAFAAADGQDLEALCDEVLERMVAAGAEDDVALVAVRFFDQDRPLPPTAPPRAVPEGVAED